MIRSLQKYCLGAVLIFSLMTAYGCVPLIAGAAVGAGGIAYVRGALIENINKTVSEIHAASLAAFKDLELFVTDDELNRHSAVIKAEYEEGPKVRVNIEALTEYVSEISIRVGNFGDQEESRMILDAIREKL